MDHLEESVRELKHQNITLISEVEELKRKNELLINTNEELKKSLRSWPYTCSCINKSEEEKRKSFQEPSMLSSHTSVKDVHSFERPAVSLKLPLQKGQWTTLAEVLTKTPSLNLWKLFLVYLLSQKCWTISKKKNSLMTLKDWQQVCWKKLTSMSSQEFQGLYLVRYDQLEFFFFFIINLYFMISLFFLGFRNYQRKVCLC